MGQLDGTRSVALIKARMKGRGIDLDSYISQITKKWDSTPCGFDFTCLDRDAYLALMTALVQNQDFGSDDMIGGSQHYGASFREVSQPDSLHIILTKRSNPGTNQSGPVRPTCNVHLDSVSPVMGRDPATGKLIYDTSKVLQHLATDLLHTPLIVPSGAGGIVFGFRF